MTMLRRLVVLFIALTAGAAAADPYQAGALEVDKVWARVSPAGTGAAYLVIDNNGDSPDRLIAAASPVAKSAQLHTNLVEDGVVRMRRIDAIEVNPGTPTVLQPGGLHIMLRQLTGAPKPGDMVPLELTFEQAGTVRVQAVVQALGSTDYEGGHGQHESH